MGRLRLRIAVVAVTLAGLLGIAALPARAIDEPIEAVHVTGHGAAGTCTNPARPDAKVHPCVKFAYKITRHSTGEIDGHLRVTCRNEHVTVNTKTFTGLSIARFTALFRATKDRRNGAQLTVDVAGADNHDLSGGPDTFMVKITRADGTVLCDPGIQTLVRETINEPEFLPPGS